MSCVFDLCRTHGSVERLNSTNKAGTEHNLTDWCCSNMYYTRQHYSDKYARCITNVAVGHTTSPIICKRLL